MGIIKANPKNYNILAAGNPALHQNLQWYVTDNNKVLGVVVRDLVDRDFSWVVLTDGGEGYTSLVWNASLPTIAAATDELHKAMNEVQ